MSEWNPLNSRNYRRLLVILALLGLPLWMIWPWVKVAWKAMNVKMTGKKTVADRLEEYGLIVEQRLAESFRAVGTAFPPRQLVFIGLKEEKRLELFVPDASGSWRLLKSYPILAASGKAGPKLRAGDRQVPEGLYRIELLNPNSLYHLSLRVNYPNEFDRAQAAEEGRTSLGGDIMIHGNELSIGCLAMGDEAAEDLFVLAARTGLENIRVILAPRDLRSGKWPVAESGQAPWIDELYRQIRDEMQMFRSLDQDAKR